MITSLNAVQHYVQTVTSGAVTAPINGSWIAAYCLYLGVTEPVNESWIQALCNHFGITTPTYGSWVIALADYYGITYPEGGTWWIAIALNAGAPVTPFGWDTNTNLWEAETRTWN